jgi:non-ribosomal peptide synthetase component F
MITATPFHSLHPLSSPQREIWFDQLLHPDLPLYNVGGYVQINGTLDHTVFEQAINRLIQRHDALRTVLVSESPDAVPQQAVLQELSVTVPYYDCSNDDHPHETAFAWMQQQFIQSFELYEQPLFFFALLKVSEECYYWFKQYHHLIVDGWSGSLLTQSLAEIYTQLVQGQPITLATPSYFSFVQNDRAYLESARYETDLQYWLDKYQTLPEPLWSPRYFSQFLDQTPPSGHRVLSLSRPFYNQLQALATHCQATTFHLLLGAFYIYLTRTTQTAELVVGLPFLNRSNATFKQTVGLFTGVSAARFSFGTELSFNRLLQAIGRELKSNYRCQRLPLSELNRALELHKWGRRQLFDFSLSYEQHDYDTCFGTANTRHTTNLLHGYEQTPLMVYVREFHDDEDVDIDFVYNLAYFDATEIEQMQSRLRLILEYVLTHAEETICTVPLLTDAERQQLQAWNQTQTDYPTDQTIVDLFQAQVEKTPENIAVVFEDQHLTYRELNIKANQLAHYLMDLGVTTETLVGICVERSLEMVIGLWGILKAGGAYLPLDPEYPQERLQFMLEDSQVPVLLTQHPLQQKLSFFQKLSFSLVNLDSDWDAIATSASENLLRQSGPANLAYVIYTSGSTGQPKGAMNTHRGICNRLRWMQDTYQLTDRDNVLQKTPFSFDVSVWELYWPLLVGSRLTMAKPGGHQEPEYLSHLIAQQQITTLHFVPSMLRVFLQHLTVADGVSLTRVICSGEALPVELVAPFLTKFPTVGLHNL